MNLFSPGKSPYADLLTREGLPGKPLETPDAKIFAAAASSLPGACRMPVRRRRKSTPALKNCQKQCVPIGIVLQNGWQIHRPTPQKRLESIMLQEKRCSEEKQQAHELHPEWPAE
jgi:hypothetical protein